MSRPDNLIARIAAAWVEFAQRHALVVATTMLLAAAGCAYYTVNAIGINTNNSDMISAKVDWRRTYLDYQQAFPQYTDSLVAVIDADNADLADDATRKLAQALRSEPALFNNVYIPGGGEFFDRNGLLYLSTDELQSLADRLIEVQPFLGRLAPDPSLSNFFGLLADAMRPQDIDLNFELDPVFLAVAAAFEANSKDEYHRLSWRDLIAGSGSSFDTDETSSESSAEQSDSNAKRRFIELQPVLEFDALSPAAAPMSRIRALVEELNLDARQC